MEVKIKEVKERWSYPERLGGKITSKFFVDFVDGNDINNIGSYDSYAEAESIAKKYKNEKVANDTKTYICNDCGKVPCILKTPEEPEFCHSSRERCEWKEIS